MSQEHLERIIAARARAKAMKAARAAKAKDLWPHQREKARPRRTKSARRRLIDTLDTLFSLYIRLRDKAEFKGMCVFGCGRPIECCFHIVTRGKYSVRWDERNAVGSCMIDNYKMEFNPHPFITWYIKRVGVEAYEALVRDSNRIPKHTHEDLRQLAAEIRAMTANVLIAKKKGPQGQKPQGPSCAGPTP